MKKKNVAAIANETSKFVFKNRHKLDRTEKK